MKHSYYLITLIFSLFLSPTLFAQDKAIDSNQQIAYQSAKALLPDFLEFLRLPNDAHFSWQLEPNLKWLESAFQQRGFQTQRLETDGISLFLAEFNIPDAAATMLYYMHVDGQPVDSSKWFQDNPYEPALKAGPNAEWDHLPLKKLEGEIDPEWRIYARASADDKGPIVMFLAAWDAMLKLAQKPNFSVKVLIDPEEEIGSPNMVEALKIHKSKLGSDGLLILDGPMHASNQPTITFGARGIMAVHLEVYGPRLAQHSGHFGNYAPNPAFRLAHLLASMKDETGRVIIPGYYDGIDLSDSLRQELAAIPDDPEALRKHLGVGAVDQVGANLQEALQYPSLNVRGMAAAWVGSETRTIVPDKAVAEIDVRLVKETHPKRLYSLIASHLLSQGYHIVEAEPDLQTRLDHEKLVLMTGRIGYEAFRTEYDSELGKWLYSGISKGHEKSVLRLRTMGGSVPISPMIQALGVPAVVVPVVNSDNNQHSPNENLRLGNYFEGTQTLLSIFLEPYPSDNH